MPKLKVHRGVSKRVRLTKNRKVLRRHSSGNHFLQKKSAARKRRIATVQALGGYQAKTIRRQLGK